MTTSVVRQLVLQDNVFAIFNGLGTPTHLAVRDFLNTEKVPDLFVASGCTCWNDVAKAPYTFGWQTDYTIEGQIEGQYVAQTLAGKKVGYFVQNDDFGSNGAKGLDMQIKASDVVSRQTYVTSNINVQPQIEALQSAGAQVAVLYSVPAFTALALLTAAKLNYHPTWVVSNVGSDPTTLAGLLQNFSKGAAGASLAEGIITDTYATPVGDTTNPWIQLFKQIHDKYIPSLPFDGNVGYGFGAAYTFVSALVAAGKNPTRDGIVKAIQNSHFSGPGLVPFSYSASNHQGYSGVQMASIKSGAIVLQGTPFTATDTGGIKAYTTPPANPPANGIPS
jgi:ABC-type branched-subunit amino acid transport system substrate-binding protein